MRKLNLWLLKFKGKYFVYLANTCTNSIVKIKCYSEVNIISTSLTSLVVIVSVILDILIRPHGNHSLRPCLCFFQGVAFRIDR